MPIVRKTWKTESRIDWGQDLEENEFPGRDAIRMGALLRIADATELMAKNHQALINERDQYQKWYHEAREMRDRAYRQVQSLRGVITRLKKNHGKYHKPK